LFVLYRFHPLRIGAAKCLELLSWRSLIVSAQSSFPHVDFFPEIENFCEIPLTNSAGEHLLSPRTVGLLSVLVDAGKKKDFFTFEP